ncbi:MAG: GtrA family protein [Clostridia bacterium]|nr:GtrA family protein [Clostridia bacterium]
MKLKIWYENLYEKIFSIRFFKMFLKIPGLEKLLQYEILSYLVFGFLTTVVSFVSSALLLKAGGENAVDKTVFTVFGFNVKWGVHIVQVLSWVISVLFAYVTNKLFVFESRSWKPKVVAKEMSGFFGARVISLLLFDLLLFNVVFMLIAPVLKPAAKVDTASQAAATQTLTDEAAAPADSELIPAGKDAADAALGNRAADNEKKQENTAAYWIAKVLAAVFTVVFNYVASKLVIFRKKKQDGEPPQIGAEAV